jgi:predicted P-loop ATPase
MAQTTSLSPKAATPLRKPDGPCCSGLDPLAAVALDDRHRDHLVEELGAAGLAAAIRHGARSIDAAEAHRLGFQYGSHRTGGLLLPFGGDFAQLRCDDPPIASNGDPVKYLSRRRTKQAPATFGAGPATIATEGWKDALRLHLATGETTQAIAGVTNWGRLAATVTRLIYDADAAHNPAVWSQLVAAGLERRTLRLGFFPADKAGPKGGACEFFGAAGDFEAIAWHKARELLRELPKGWNHDLRADWQPHAIRHLSRLAIRAGYGSDGTHQLVVNAAKGIGYQVDRARKSVATERRKAAPPPKPAARTAPPSLRMVSAAGKPLDEKANAGKWSEVLAAGIGSRLRRNLLTQQIELDGQQLDGESEELLYVHAQRAGWNITKPDCYDGTRAVALDHSYHPVREYLDRVTADPTIEALELDTLAARYIGVTDPLSAAMVRCLLIGAVARIHRPGCTAPGVVVLRGDQGIGKSKFWEALAGAFYVVSRHEDGAKDQAMAMHRSWIYDLDELDKVTTAKQAASLRSLITAPADTFRLPYARREETFSRQFVIVGAVNGEGFLTDPEGNRRYWIIDCPQKKDTGRFIDGPGAARDRDAIWKAATIAYRAGAAWELTPNEQRASNARNGQFEAVDEWQAPLAGWAEKTITPGGFTTREAIAGAGLRLRESITRTDEMAAAASLRRAGFQRQTNATRRPDGKRERFWQLAQPAQPDTTCSAVVVPAETPSPAADLPTLAQPTQPFEEIFKGEGKGVPNEGGGIPSLSPMDMAPVVVPVVPTAETACAAVDLGRHNQPTQPRRLCQEAAAPIHVDGKPGWSLPGSMPKGDGPTVKVLCIDPRNRSRLIERRRISAA